MPLSPARPVPYPLRAAARLLVLGAVFAAAYGLAFALRADFAVTEADRAVLLASLPWVVGVKLAVAVLMRGFVGWVRYVSFPDLLQLGRATAFAGLGLLALDLLVFGGAIPPGVVALDPLLTFLMVGGLRSAGRLFREQLRPMLRAALRRGEYRKVVLVGANRNGVVLANQINAQASLRLRVVGFVDDDVPALHGSQLGGVDVLGGLERAAAARGRGAKDVLVVAGSVPGDALRKLMAACEPAGVRVKIIANVYDLLGGRAATSRLRVRDVDINDLLRREPVALDGAAVGTMLEGRVVMVTGAGGSIGSEICRQALRFKPRALVLVERAENSLFHVERELRVPGGPPVHPFIADITDGPRMRQVFDALRPDVVFHAAAHKHVPLMESNPGEALKNNVLGTKAVADLAHEYGANSFVLISTDKAVRPTSVMGLSKQLAERYVHALSQASPTRFVAVRFGNVLGSAGSVVPLFQEQIRAGRPITVTHPEMRRYFMTIPEASQLVLQAGAMGRGGEIFELDMGEPVKIVDLARDMIRLSGLDPDEVEVVFTGVRKGEKLFEELYLADEETLPTPHPKVRVGRHRPHPLAEVCRLLEDLRGLAAESDPAAVERGLRDRFPEFGPDARTPVAAPAEECVEATV